MPVILMQVSHVRFEVLTSLLLKTRVFWDVINSQCFKESQRLHLQGQEVNELSFECFTFKIKALRSLTTLKTNHLKQHHIPQDTNFQIIWGFCLFLNANGGTDPILVYNSF